MPRTSTLSLSEQVAFIQETEGLLFHRWRTLWEKSESGRVFSPLKELTSSQLHTVMVVHFEGEVTISRLARLQGVSKASASVMVDRLGTHGALVREQDANDRRKTVLRVSPEYEAYVEEAMKSRRRHRMALARKIGEEAVRKWYEALKRVREVFEAADE